MYHIRIRWVYAPKDRSVIEDMGIGVKATENGGFDVFGFAAHNEGDDFVIRPTSIFYHYVRHKQEKRNRMTNLLQENKERIGIQTKKNDISQLLMLLRF